jgi:hypothetical protein
MVEAKRLRVRRNDVTHSVLPNPSEQEAFAWLPAAPAGQALLPLSPSCFWLWEQCCVPAGIANLPVAPAAGVAGVWLVVKA